MPKLNWMKTEWDQARFSSLVYSQRPNATADVMTPVAACPDPPLPARGPDEGAARAGGRHDVRPGNGPHARPHLGGGRIRVGAGQ